MMREPGMIIAPGVAEAMSARVVKSLGFNAIYMTGSGSSAIRLGMPDMGLMTSVEMVDNAQRIAEASGLPLIADADEGFGGPLNVRRTVRAYERAGVAGVHLEDQQLPKRCGHLAGKTLIPEKDMCAKIRAACDARTDADFFLIARTDAVSVEGLDRALERALKYEEAGADMIFIEAPSSVADAARITKTLKGPALYCQAAVGSTPLLTAAEIEKLGFKLAIYPNYVVLAMLTASTSLLKELKDTGSVAQSLKGMASFAQLFDVLGMKEVEALSQRYAVD
jgi:2-methylisocitrate lyase-like PEP mutase family enzyme